MAKPEWGTKRTCYTCGIRFYDLRRNPAVCPKCGAESEAEAPIRLRRGLVVERVKAEAAPPPVIEEEDDPVVDSDALEKEEALEEMDAEEEEGVIEDASDLGEDDDDMAEVMEHLDDQEEKV